MKFYTEEALKKKFKKELLKNPEIGYRTNWDKDKIGYSHSGFHNWVMDDQSIRLDHADGLFRHFKLDMPTEDEWRKWFKRRAYTRDVPFTILSERSGYGRSALIRWANGKHTIYYNTLERLVLAANEIYEERKDIPKEKKLKYAPLAVKTSPITE